MERGNPLRRLPFAKEKGTPLNGVAYCRYIRRWERIGRDSAPLKGDCEDEDRWRRHLDDDDLERKDQARMTGEVLGGMTNLDVED